ncbi:MULTISPECIES: hypothetical protein [Deefgea]|uniref:Uncharacterized protein n=1 Tax=Deefgea chitinilytica TaxID=570276 RepID=A0ABS2CBH9_9NEIS|nr:MULTISPECIES: hypothetical protein [Deefgea]MBM5571000.1 hypothetical protein [Deefgea chitinilytica]MBM9888230.1 hypothetical protein [Deefgea sp. CFH1-16]
MDIVPQEMLIAVAKTAKLDGLSPEETMTLVFRALDHEMRGPGGQRFNPARTDGIGRAIYAALFNYPLSLKVDTKASNGFRWEVAIPAYGYSAPFEQMFVDALLRVEQQRSARTKVVYA